MPQKHSRVIQGKRFVWFTQRLWELAHNLPIKHVKVESLPEFDQNCWFGQESPPTCRAVARHTKRINEADLSYPIILSSEGYLMDGGHRIAKAWLLDLQEIKAVQFPVDPEPDYILEPDVSLRDLQPRLSPPAA